MVNVPDYGAPPLAKLFVLLRGLALICMIGIVGMTANFVAQIINSNVDPPREILGTLVIACLATLYCLVSIAFFWAPANIGLLVMAGTDALLLIAFVVVSVLLGKPLSFLDCPAIANVDAAANAQSTAALVQSLTTNFGHSGASLGLGSWAGSTKLNCYETKAIWGLCISLCIIFTCSTSILPALFYKQRRGYGGSGGYAKSSASGYYYGS